MMQPAPETGVPAVDTIVIWCAAAAVVAGGITVIWRATRSVRRLGHRVDNFIDDWHGTAPRPGVPARPGVMERLDRIEHHVGLVAHEVRPNSGSSLRDAVDRVDERTARILPDRE